ncbi:radical SAM protein [Actinomyces sp. 2119]|uniref:Radical SAM protein n=1 Tax=Actinomyces lilanjuaniae TaxID=2321394 RepID=A0ABM6Z737_9ACTO|nr:MULTISPECIES: 4Fe-4S single cluster domain-containing protein [Actinomyces]AYD91037.1 radical SAM protein [Actinomyces lilanjuaniae]RJF43898.1 radical SAM protein [Actinomyces sp. 2119]
MSDPILLARLLERTRAEGPGLRTALWVQGCTIRCRGCFNPHLWGKRGGTPVEPDSLLQRIPEDVEGVTFLGGEPFEQPEALARLAYLVRRRGQTVMTFTGYWLERLRCSRAPGVAGLLANTDLLVDGPFDIAVPDHRRPWVGSVNQRFHALTPRYARLVSRLDSVPDRLEVRVDPTGAVSVNGWASTDALDALLERL